MIINYFFFFSYGLDTSYLFFSDILHPKVTPDQQIAPGYAWRSWLSVSLVCAVAPGSISSAVKSKWKTASSAPNTRVLSPVIGSSEDPGYSDLEPSPWICLSLMPLLCVFSHPRPRLSGFIPAQLASSLARSWGRDREHSEPIFAPPPT